MNKLQKVGKQTAGMKGYILPDCIHTEFFTSQLLAVAADNEKKIKTKKEMRFVQKNVRNMDILPNWAFCSRPLICFYFSPFLKLEL